MKHSFTFKGKTTDGNIKNMVVKVQVTTEGLTRQEAKDRINTIKNGAHDLLRSCGRFDVAEIKIA
jgi:hypothetical protein